MLHRWPLVGGIVALIVTSTTLTSATASFHKHHFNWIVRHGLVAGSHTHRTMTPTPKPSATPTPTVTVVPTAKTTPRPVVIPPAPGRFGLSVGNTLPGLPAAELAARLNDMKSLGISWIRIDLDWNDIQPTGASSYSWDRFDAVVTAAHARGINVLPIITYTAPWARSSACPSNPMCAPANPAQFATFANAAATRYAPRGVHHWEVWNEPNQAGFWAPASNAAAFTKLLVATYPAIKRADPNATVVSGGLASTETSGGNIAQLDFLAGMYANGAAGHMDAVGYHPYSFPVPPTYPATWNAWAKMGMNTTSFRTIMAAHGDGAKQIWVTEYGAPTNGPGALATLTNYNLNASPDHVDEAYQAALATQFVRVTTTYPWAGPAFWYSYKDIGTSTSSTENFYGLIRYDGSHKPAYNSLKSEIAAHH
jgi:hypothetical protein